MTILSSAKRSLRLLMCSCFLCASAAMATTLIDNVNDLMDWSVDSSLKVEPPHLKISLSKDDPHDNLRTFTRSFPAEILAGKTILLEFDIKGENIVRGKRHWHTVKMIFSYIAGDGKVNYADAGGQSGTFDWRTVRYAHTFPKDTRSEVTLRIGFQNSTGTIWLRNMKLKVLGTPVSIESVANIPYVDEVQGDKKGGWTDQGETQDGRYLQEAMRNKRHLSGMPFLPKLSGNGILAMKSARSPFGVEQATLQLPEKTQGRFLYILHTGAWLSKKSNDSVGQIIVKAKNGMTQTMQVRQNLDIGDWWNPSHLPNAGIAVRAKRPDGIPMGLYASRFALQEHMGDLESVQFVSVNGNAIWLIAGLAFSDDYLEVPKSKPLVIREGENWQPVAFAPRNVRKPNSALDVSQYYPFQKAGELGRVIINKDGRFAFEKEPDKPVHFYANSIGGGVINACGDKEGIKLFCQEMRKAGFNMIRTHFLDTWLMQNSEKPGEINKERLDQFDYLVYQMKEHGIYLNFDCMTGFLGYNHGNDWNARLTPECYKGQIHFSQAVKENWRKGVEHILTHVNPYTKTRLVDEPLLAMTHGYNEQEFAFMRPLKPEQCGPAFYGFLEKHYGTIGAFNKQFNTNYAAFKDIPMFEESKLADKYVRLFMFDTELKMMKWYRQQLNELGYKGPVSNYNMLKDQHYNSLRRFSDYVSINTYHDHPSGQTLKTISNRPALGIRSGHYRGAISTRQAGKPFVVTEYASVFWNQYRYDHSFAFASYAALQDIDVLTSHSGSVSVENFSDTRKNMVSFFIANDPVRIAAEYLGFFMYVRGDIKPANKHVRIAVDMDSIYESKAAIAPISTAQNLLALVTGFSIECKDASTPLAPLQKNEMRLQRSGGSSVITDLSGFSQTVDGTTDASQIIEAFKKNGFLPKNNKTDGVSIFDSITKEIYLDASKSFMKIDTPRLQGFCALEKSTGKATDFTLNELKENGCVAVVSIDGMKPIKSAKRMTVVFATDAKNKLMTFKDDDQRQVLSMGRWPVLLKTGAFTATVRNDHASKLKLYALDLAGNRIKQIKTTKVNGNAFTFSVDTKVDGTSVFFELVAE